MKEIVVDKIWLTETEIWIRTTEGEEACEKFADYPRLKNAASERGGILHLMLLVLDGKILTRIYALKVSLRRRKQIFCMICL